MLLIFDLDDTLIDTSGCSVPIKLKDALLAMVNAGLKIDSFEESLNLFKEIDNKSPNGEQSLKLFLQEINSPQFFEIGLKEYCNPIPPGTVINTLRGAKELLINLKRNHILAIVSKGEEKLQFQKMQIANLNTELFSKIIITDKYNKGDKYKQLMEEFNSTPQNTLVIGDKFYSDLQPAQQLGIKTVQMMWGRALKFPEEGADHKINKLEELNDII